MFDWLIRNYEKGVRRLFQQRGGVIENRQPPIPGIIQIAAADAIAQIFDGDAKRQEVEYSRVMQRFEDSGSPNLGTRNGVSFISFNHRR